MNLDQLIAYVPMDRRHALARGCPLPDRTAGSVLFADIAGFTPLTDALATALGPRRGAEELTQLLNTVYEALLAPIHHYGGSVIGFSGDGLTASFDGDPGLRATACALALQAAIAPFAAVPTSTGETVSLRLKAAVAAGPVRRLLVGDPGLQRLDVLAGTTVDRMAQAEQVANQGEVVVAPEPARQLGERLKVRAWRDGFAVASGLSGDVAPNPWPHLDVTGLDVEQVRPYLLHPVYERLMSGQGEFLAELRPAVALFLRFGGLDYDDDDEAEAKLDAYVRWVQGVLDRYGGYLLQLTTGEKGSYLYASFGTLGAHEDDAERALAAATELRQPPSNLAFITWTQIGLSQGRVRAGAYGSQTRRTYGAQGDEVIVAARLMQVAPPGEVRCSQPIYQAARGEWTFEGLPAVEVKGKSEPLPVYRPLRRRGERGARAAGPLVGRQAEVATLARLLEETGAGQRRVLLLEGEAGIGKSRLLAELRQRAREQGVTWLEGAGQSIEQGTPYRAWRDLLAAHFALDNQMSLEDRQRRVRERVTDVRASLVERAPLLNDILRLDLPETSLTRSFDPQLRRESLTALVADLLRATATAGPLILVLEDAHWLDSLSWGLALSMARALHDRPLLLALALRPLEEPPPAAYTTLAGLEGVKTVRLEAMPPDETVALAAARLGLPADMLPPEVANLIRERAEGNPFFAEELAYALRDSGALVVEEGFCNLVGDLEALRQQVPDTVEGVVLSRIDRLPPEEQLTLKVAAVIGRSFLYRTLRDVHPRQVMADLLHAHLDDLTRRDLTLLETLEPELTYLFKHVITQQVTYDTLLFAQRRELHHIVAGWYERVYDHNLSPYYPLLVHHWNRAEDISQERRYARLAGEQAAAQFANAEAVGYLSRALELTPQDDLTERYALLLAREEVYGLQGERAAQKDELAALEALAETLEDTERRAEVMLRQSNYAWLTGDHSAAITAAQTAIDLAQDEESQAKGYLAWGRSLVRQGEYGKARTQIEQTLGLARKRGARQVEADSLRSLGIASWYQDDHTGARSHYTQSLHIFHEIGDRRGESAVLNNLGMVSWSQGDNTEAMAYYDQSLHIKREIGDRKGESAVLNNLGNVCWSQHDHAGARAYYEESLRIKQEVGDRQGEGLTLFNLGLVSNAQNDFAGAMAFHEQALLICREIGDRQQEGMALVNQGTILEYLGDYAGARACYEQGLLISHEIGDRQHESLALADLGLLFHRLGDDETSLEYSQKALLITQEIDSRSTHAQNLQILGHTLTGLGRLAEAADAYSDALDIRREIGEHIAALESLAGLARVSLIHGELLQAWEHIGELLSHLETNPTLDGTDEFFCYLTCYDVLRAHHDPRAEATLVTAHRLLQERAHRIEDEKWRRSFLENVQVHRQIITAYKRAHQMIGENGQTD